MQDPFKTLLATPEEVTSEVIPPKRRGRPPKNPVLASPAVEPSEPVTVVVSEPEPKAPPAPQSMSARTLAEIEAGRRTLEKQRRR